MSKIVFECTRTRADGVQLYRLMIDGVTVREDLTIDEVIEAVETVMSGGNYFSPALLQNISRNLHSHLDENEELISQREHEILVGICRGLSNQEIADELFISKRTVDKHLANILEKTGCKNTAALVVYAIRNGVVEL